MVAKCFAAVMTKISSCFFSTTYVSSISNNIALIIKTVELAVSVRTGNVNKLWFWTSFPHDMNI